MKNRGKSGEKQRSYSQKTTTTPKERRKSQSYTQGDKIDEDFEEMLPTLSLKKPKRAFNFFIMEMKEKDKSTANITELTKKYSKKWSSMSDSDKRKYENMAEEDKKRYEEHLEMVRRNILDKPTKEGATAYRLFLESELKNAAENDEDQAQAKKDASAKWKDMTKEQRKEWTLKKKEHDQWYEELKKSTGVVNAYSLFLKDMVAEKGMDFKGAAEAWNKAKDSVKSKYQEYADQANEERKKQRDTYEIAFGVKPRRPLGAYKFFMMEAAKEGKFGGKNPISEGPKLWKKLNDDDKEKYQRMAMKEKLAYAVKKLEYDQMTRKTSTTRPLTAFQIYLSDNKGKVDAKEFGKQGFLNYMHKKWQKLDEGTRKKYSKKADDSKARAEKDNETLAARVHDMPKRPGNPLSLYVKENYSQFKKDNPKKGNTEILGLIAETFAGLSEKQKERYRKNHEKAMEEYKANKKAFEKQGFYTAEKEKKTRKARSASSGKGTRGKK